MRLVYFATSLLAVAIDSVKAVELLNQMHPDLQPGLENRDHMMAQSAVNSWITNKSHINSLGPAPAPAQAHVNASPKAKAAPAPAPSQAVSKTKKAAQVE